MNTTVRPDHAPFPLYGLSGSHHLVSKIDDSLPIIGMNQIFKSGQCPGKAARRQAVQCFRFRRPNINSSSKVQIKGSNASSPLCQSQPFFAPAQCLLCPPALSNVENHADYAFDLATLVKICAAVSLQPNDRTIRTDHPISDLKSWVVDT